MSKTLTCSACGKEFTQEEANQQGKVVFSIPDKEVVLCADCTQAALRVAMAKQQAANGPKIIMSNDVVGSARKEAQEDQLAHDEYNRLKKVVASTSPAKIKAHLDDYIIGQEHAKKILAVAAYNHYKRLAFAAHVNCCKRFGKDLPASYPSVVEKSNIIMVGGTGTGKTAILKAIAEYLDVPFSITDCNSLTASGFVGQDPESAVRELWMAAGRDTKKAEYGIIFLDEFDKLARKSGANPSITSDPSRESVQQALLKIIEGSMVNFNPSSTRRNPDAPGIYMDTSNILFVVGGAFEGIEKIIDKRISTEGGFGLASNGVLGLDSLDDEIERHNKLIDSIATEDFTKFGIIPELLGRTPIICKMHNLTADEMVRILTEPKNAIVKQYRTMFIMDKCNLKFEDEALKAIAEKAIETKTGARALRTIVENLLLDTMFDLPDKCRNAEDVVSSVTVSKDNVTDEEPLEINQMPVAA